MRMIKHDVVQITILLSAQNIVHGYPLTYLEVHGHKNAHPAQLVENVEGESKRLLVTCFLTLFVFLGEHEIAE